jgi:four helix bundle protein
MRDYHKLQVWSRAHLLALRVYRHTARFPRDERFGLTAQMRRAAASVPTNIVEGSGRPTPSDYSRFLGIAASSPHELQYHLELARDLGYGDVAESDAMRREAAEIRAMLTALRSKINPRSRPVLADD